MRLWRLPQPPASARRSADPLVNQAEAGWRRCLHHDRHRAALAGPLPPPPPRRDPCTRASGSSASKHGSSTDPRTWVSRHRVIKTGSCPACRRPPTELDHGHDGPAPGRRPQCTRPALVGWTERTIAARGRCAACRSSRPARARRSPWTMRAKRSAAAPDAMAAAAAQRPARDPTPGRPVGQRLPASPAPPRAAVRGLALSMAMRSAAASSSRVAAALPPAWRATAPPGPQPGPRPSPRCSRQCSRLPCVASNAASRSSRSITSACRPPASFLARIEAVISGMLSAVAATSRMA